MVYADYGYYSCKYYGLLSESSFRSMILKASKEIDKNVNTRLTESKINNLSKEAQDSLKYTDCALVDLMAKKQESDSKKLSSYSIDGVSKTYKVISEEDFGNSKKDILTYLSDELTCYK